MKILVIDASYCVYTNVDLIGIGSLIIYENLKQINNKVSVLSDKIQINKGKEKLADYILKNKYNVICISTRGDTHPYALSLAKIIKEKKPEIKIILGGPQATLTARKTIEKYDFIDVIIKGAGEGLIQKVINSGFQKKELAKIENIVYRIDGEVIENEYIRNLCKIKFPLQGFQKYNSTKNVDEIYIEAGRGCNFNCSYCVTNKIWDKTYFIRDSKDIINEIKNIRSKIKFKNIYFIHDNILSNKLIGEKFLLGMIEDLPKDIKWTASVRIDLLDEKIIKLLKKAGCKDLYIGLETGSQAMQKIYNKYINLDKAVDNFLYLEKFKINFTVSLIIGHPDEKLDDVFESIYLAIFLKNLNHCICIQFHKLAFVFASPLYEKYKKDICFIKSQVSDQANIILDKEEEEMVISDKDIFSTFYSYNGKMKINNLYIKRENIELIVNTYYRCLNEIIKNIELNQFKIVILKKIDDLNEIIDWIKSYKGKIGEYFDSCLELESAVCDIICKENIEFNNNGINKTLRFIKNNNYNCMIWKSNNNCILLENLNSSNEKLIKRLIDNKKTNSKKGKELIYLWNNNNLIK